MDMEMENVERQEAVDPRRNRYVVYTCRDIPLMKTFIRFSNRVKHPRMGVNLFIVGVLLFAIPIMNKGIATPGMIISYVMGALLVGIALFRTSISASMMKGSPGFRENEELTYMFGNNNIRVEKDGKIEDMGYYKTVYRVWEDEYHFYVGMDSEDLLILPKKNFVEGDPANFRDFILEKTGASFKWLPVKIGNRIKGAWLSIQTKMSGMEREMEEDAKKINKK